MKRLRKTQRRMDTLRTETRPRKRGRFGRFVYLGLLLALALALFDLFAGDLVYLRGEGMVARDISVVAPEYAGSVLSIDVASGGKVQAGQPLAVIRSHRMLKDIAELSAQVAASERQLSELRIQRHKLRELIPAARKRVEATNADRTAMTRLRQSGHTTVNRAATAESNAFKALEDLKALESEAALVESEYLRLEETAERSRQALNDIETLYDDGIVRAPRDGLVGDVLVAPGEGIKEGQRVVEIFHGEPYVLAYLPLGTLYDVSPGDRVVVRYGFQTLSGTLETLQPLAFRVPEEFQRQFQTVERKQLVRIRLDEGVTPPLFAEIEVTWPNAISVILVSVAKSATDIGQAAWNDALAWSRQYFGVERLASRL